MKTYIEDFISEEERAEVFSIGESSRSKIYISECTGVVRSIFERINEISKIDPHERGYARVEHLTRGHGWHKDTGTDNAMSWCSFGCSILLSDPKDFEGGDFHYREGKVDQKTKSLVMHSSDVEHLVTKHSGKRVVLLYFF